MNTYYLKYSGGILFSIFSLAHSLSSTNIKPMQKQHLVFFPARFQIPLPSEMYTKFISKLSDNFEVHIASSDPRANDKLFENILTASENDNIGLISHSSGVADLWNTYSSTDMANIDKIILIEPLDLQKGNSVVSPLTKNYFMRLLNINMDAIKLDNINDKIGEIVETDYIELMKSNIKRAFFNKVHDKSETGDEEGCDICDMYDTIDLADIQPGNLLVVKHKQSYKWRYIPTIPPISLLNSDLKKFQDTMIYCEVVIENFSHFDILDRPWANIMNRVSLGTNKNQDELDNYLNIIDDIVIKLMS